MADKSRKRENRIVSTVKSSEKVTDNIIFNGLSSVD